MAIDPPLIDSLQPKAAPYKVTYGAGMYLLLNPNGSKWWRLDYRFGGKRKTLSLGVYPQVGLAEARDRRDKARTLLAQGIDPSECAKMARAKERDEQARQKAATRFVLDSHGALSFRLGNRCLALTPTETIELRAFLDATRSVIPKR